jgi:hypothetical protein
MKIPKNVKNHQKRPKSPKTGVSWPKPKNGYFPLIYHAKTPIYRNNSATRTSKKPTALIIALLAGFYEIWILNVILFTSALLFKEQINVN